MCDESLGPVTPPWRERLGAAATTIWATYLGGEQTTADRRVIRQCRERLITSARRLDELQNAAVIPDSDRPSDLASQQMASLLATLERRDESILLYVAYTARQIGAELDAALARQAEQAKP